MHRLRVYINSSSAAELERHGFYYSRRADGPFYCWFQEERGQWQFTRVHLPESALRLLCIEKWKAVPVTLRVRLSEHYLE